MTSTTRSTIPAGYAEAIDGASLGRDEFIDYVIAPGGAEIVNRARVAVSRSTVTVCAGRNPASTVTTEYGTLRGRDRQVRFTAARGQNVVGGRTSMLIHPKYNNFHEHGFIGITVPRKVYRELRSNFIHAKLRME